MGWLGGALGQRWVKAGHEVTFSSRHPDELAAMMRPLGLRASIGTPRQAAGFGSFGLGVTLTWHGDLSPSEAGRLCARNSGIGQRVEARLQSAYSAALEMVRRKRPMVERLADVPVDRQVLTGDEVRAVLASIAYESRPVRVVGEKRPAALESSTPASLPCHPAATRGTAMMRCAHARETPGA